MLFREEIIFVDKLFDALDYLGVETLATNIACPGNAVGRFRDYLKTEMPKYYKRIGVIFATENLSGDYSRFRSAIADREKVRTKSSFSMVMEINPRERNPNKKFIGLAKKFCEFTDIEN